MSFWILLLFLGTATAAGFSLVRFVSAGMRLPETIAWSFAAGLILQAVIEALLLLLRARPGPGNLLAAQAAVILGSAFLRRPGNRNAGLPPAEALRPLAWALAALAAAGVILFTAQSLSLGAWPTDFLAIWGLKGRTIFATAAIPERLFHDRALFWAHPEYPLLVPLTFAALSSAMQSWDARALALFYPICQAATLCALWGFLARRVSPVAAGAGACLAGYCTGLYGPGNVGTAEIPLAFAFVLLATAATDVLDGRQPASARWRLVIASTLAAATKQEGALFCALLALCLVALPRYRRRAGTAWLWLTVPVVAHGILLRIARGAVERRDYDLSLLEPSRWSALTERGGIVLGHLATVEVPRAAIALAALALFFLISRAGVADWLLLPTFAQVTVYAALSALSAFGARWLLEASFARITLVLFPVLSLIVASRLLDEGSRHRAVGEGLAPPAPTS